MSLTSLYIQTWMEARTRLSNQLSGLTEAQLPLKLDGTQNSAGFLIRHIADVELLFAKNVFKGTGITVHAKTVIEKRDTGEWIHLHDLLAYQQSSFDILKQVLESQKDEAWPELITTNEFGVKTKAEALGRIISHTAYHAGQLALILKYASKKANS